MPPSYLYDACCLARCVRVRSSVCAVYAALHCMVYIIYIYIVKCTTHIIYTMHMPHCAPCACMRSSACTRSTAPPCSTCTLPRDTCCRCTRPIHMRPRMCMYSKTALPCRRSTCLCRATSSPLRAPHVAHAHEAAHIATSSLLKSLREPLLLGLEHSASPDTRPSSGCGFRRARLARQPERFARLVDAHTSMRCSIQRALSLLIEYNALNTTRHCSLDEQCRDTRRTRFVCVRARAWVCAHVRAFRTSSDKGRPADDDGRPYMYIYTYIHTCIYMYMYNY
jgi:hypothetical protein